MCCSKICVRFTTSATRGQQRSLLCLPVLSQFKFNVCVFLLSTAKLKRSKDKQNHNYNKI